MWNIENEDAYETGIKQIILLNGQKCIKYLQIPGLNAKVSVKTKNFFKRTANRISNLINDSFEISYFNDYDRWTAEFSMSRQYL